MKTLLLCMISCAATLAYAQVSQEVTHPIEIELKRCTAAATSVAEKTVCADQSYKAWEYELNGIYRNLLNNLVGEQKETLKTSQRSWIEYREAQEKYNDTFFASNNNNVDLTAATQRNADTVRERALLLYRYKNTIEGK